MTFAVEPFVTDNILLLSVLLFLAGVVEDVLDTWVTFTVVKRQTVTTALITFFGHILDFTVFISFISNLDKWPVIICYAAGATVGSAGVIELQKRSTRKKKELRKEKRLKGYRKAKLAKIKAERLAKKVAKVILKPIVRKLVEQKPELKKPEVVAVKKVQTVETKTDLRVKNETPTSTIKSNPAKPTV